MTEKLTSPETKKESILTRDKIEAPANFVSVFHETKEEFIESIDKGGLKLDTETKNIGDSDEMVLRNRLIDKYRPKKLQQFGVSRQNIYAYPYLEHGHGLGGAANKFAKDHRRFQREQPGEILELKVDPAKCYIGRMEYITNIHADIAQGLLPEEEAIEFWAKEYWDQIITLQDFLKWYKKPEFDEEGEPINPQDYKVEPVRDIFYLLKDAPEELAQQIEIPEILIPEDIPQKHIKVVK